LVRSGSDFISEFKTTLHI